MLVAVGEGGALTLDKNKARRSTTISLSAKVEFVISKERTLSALVDLHGEFLAEVRFLLRVGSLSRRREKCFKTAVIETLPSGQRMCRSQRR